MELSWCSPIQSQPTTTEETIKNERTSSSAASNIPLENESLSDMAERCTTAHASATDEDVLLFQQVPSHTGGNYQIVIYSYGLFR